MTSKIRHKLMPNGNIVDITTGGDKIIQGAVATTEYHLTIDATVQASERWRDTDLVWIIFKRPDGLESQFKMNRTQDGWVVTTNGWETDVEVGELKINYWMKRYSTVSIGKVVADKPTEQITTTIQPASGWVPQGIEISVAEELQQDIQFLETYKVDRVNVLDFDASKFNFTADGPKTFNAFFYNAKYIVVDAIDYEGNKTFLERQGALLVSSDTSQDDIASGQNGDTYEQTEIFFSNGRIWQRTVKLTMTNGSWETTEIGDFLEIGTENVLALIDSAIAFHNADTDAHTELFQETLEQANAYTDDEIARAKLQIEKWMPAIQTFADLPTTIPNDDYTWLIKVIHDPDATKNGVYQVIPNGLDLTANWSLYSDESDFVNETELSNAIREHDQAPNAHEIIIQEHNTDSTAHDDIRQAIQDLKEEVPNLIPEDLVNSPDNTIKHMTSMTFDDFNLLKDNGQLAPLTQYSVDGDPEDIA